MIHPQPSTEPQSPLHLQIATDHCPWCDQLIPHERFEEIRSRIEVEERSRAAQAEQRLRGGFATERAQIELKAKADLDQVKRESQALADRTVREAGVREVAAREEGRRLAEAAALEVAVAERRTAQQVRQALEEKLLAAEVATAALESERSKASARLIELTNGAAAREASAREDGRRTAELAALEAAVVERSNAQREKQALEGMLSSHPITAHSCSIA